MWWTRPQRLRNTCTIPSCYQTDTTQGGSFWRDPFMWGACFHCGYIVGTLSVWYSRLGAVGLKGSWPLRLYPTVAYMYHCDRGKLSRQKTFVNWWFSRRKLLACAVPKEATPTNFTGKLLWMATKLWNLRKCSPSKVSRYAVANTEVFYQGNFGEAQNITILSVN